MTSAPAPAFTSEDLILYERLLFELHGPHGREIQLDVGGVDVYDAIATRASGAIAARDPADAWLPDDIDLAVIRAVTRSVLERHYEPEFLTLTGHSFAEVEALQRKATAVVRRRRSGAGQVSIWIGDRRIQFPARIVREAQYKSRVLIAVPTVSAWDQVYGHVRAAASLRRDALKTLNDTAHSGEWVEEFEAESYWDLQEQATARARELSSWSRLTRGAPTEAS